MPLISGCQTTGELRPDLKVPAVLDPLFLPCQPGDGATTLAVFDGGQLLGSGEVEWLAKNSEEWDLEVSSAVGTTLLKLGRRAGVVNAEGRLAKKIPPLTVNKGGYLEVDGHVVGLKAEEIPCLLNFGLPRKWMNQISNLVVSDRRTVVEFVDNGRRMTVTATDFGKRGKEQVCTDLTWRTFLWFHDTLTWCQAPAGKREATLIGFRDYSLKWVKLDDQ